MAKPGTHPLIIELAERSGIPYKVGSDYRPGAMTKSGNVSHHAGGNAVDFSGFDQDDLATFFMSQPTLEVIHKSRRTGKWYGSSRGKPIDPAKNATLVKDHENHLHVAMASDQFGPDSILDRLRKGLKITIPSLSPGIAMGGTLIDRIPTPGNVTEALSNAGNALYSIAQSAMSVGEVASVVTRAFLPSNLLRGAAFLFGLMFTLIGIWFLAREVKESSP